MISMTRAHELDAPPERSDHDCEMRYELGD